MQIEEFNKDIVRFIRTFSDVHSVYAEMIMENGIERWCICAPNLDSKYMVPSGTTVGDALRMFPEFRNII